MVRTKKNIYCQNVFVLSLTESITLQRLLFHPQCCFKGKTGHYIWSDLNYSDTIQSMNGIVCWYNLLCFENNMPTQKELIIRDNSGIDYSWMLLFVLGFLVYWKIEPNSHVFSHIRQHVVYDLISKRSHLNCKKKKMWCHRQFLRLYYNK